MLVRRFGGAYEIWHGILRTSRDAFSEKLEANQQLLGVLL
jgi:hypothetical protein